MLKLTICLSTVLFASAANVSSWQNDLNIAKWNTEHIISNTISLHIEKCETIVYKFDEEFEELNNNLYNFSDGILENTMKIIHNVAVELFNVPKYVDTTKCIELTTNLDYIGRAVIKNMNQCFKDQLQSKLEYIDLVNNFCKKTHTQLNNIRDRAQHCFDKVVGQESLTKAIICANIAEIDARWESVKAIQMSKHRIQSSDKLLNFDMIVNTCLETSGYEVLYGEACEIEKYIYKLTGHRIAVKLSKWEPHLAHLAKVTDNAISFP